eukprot:3101627-Alexandrium_andersonii.AAC.1
MSSDDEVPPELLMPVPPGSDAGRSSLLERDFAEVIDDAVGGSGQPILPIATEGLLGSARAPPVGVRSMPPAMRGRALANTPPTHPWSSSAMPCPTSVALLRRLRH